MLSSTQISRKQITLCAIDFQEGASIIDKNLERASDLVKSFKQVAVDQTSNRRRIPEEALLRFFFFTSRFGHGGSGLGLSIVYGLVTQTLGGKISLSSRVNEGRCFILELAVNAPESCTASENSANLAG
jgi:K+-sensing histidine kinase KdpD